MIVLILVLISVPLQLMGYTGTCTQGGDDEALTGALFSAPFLLVAVLIMARHWRRGGKSSVAHMFAGLVAVGLIASTSLIWLGILRFGNGCAWTHESEGPFDLADVGFSLRNALMIGFYLVVPSLVVGLAWLDKALYGWTRLLRGR